MVVCLERLLLLLLWDLMMAVLRLLREGESCRVMVAVAVGWILVLAQRYLVGAESELGWRG